MTRVASMSRLVRPMIAAGRDFGAPGPACPPPPAGAGATAGHPTPRSAREPLAHEGAVGDPGGIDPSRIDPKLPRQEGNQRANEADIVHVLSLRLDVRGVPRIVPVPLDGVGVDYDEPLPVGEAAEPRHPVHVPPRPASPMEDKDEPRRATLGETPWDVE